MRGEREEERLRRRAHGGRLFPGCNLHLATHGSNVMRSPACTYCSVSLYCLIFGFLSLHEVWFYFTAHLLSLVSNLAFHYHSLFALTSSLFVSLFHCLTVPLLPHCLPVTLLVQFFLTSHLSSFFLLLSHYLTFLPLFIEICR